MPGFGYTHTLNELQPPPPQRQIIGSVHGIEMTDPHNI